MDNLDQTNKSCTKMPLFSDIPAKQLSLLASVLGLALIDDLDTDQQNVIGNFLVSVGQSVLTAAAAAAASESKASKSNDKPDSDMDIQIKFLKNQLSMLEDQVNANSKEKKTPRS